MKTHEWLQAYRSHLRLQQRRSPRTIESYCGILARFLAEQENEQGEPSFESGCISNYLRHLSKNLAPASQALSSSALKSFLAWAEAEGIEVPKLEPLKREITRPKLAKKLVRIVDEEDILVLARALKLRPWHEQLLFELLYGSGLRISEAHGLKRQNVDLEAGTLEIRGKRSKLRLVPLTSKARALLSEPFEPDSGIWPEATSVRSLRRWVERWGLTILTSEGTSGNLHPHKLRHSIASHLLRRGARLPQIQKLLGHSQLRTTEIYTHLETEDLVRVYDKSFPKLKR